MSQNKRCTSLKRLNTIKQNATEFKNCLPINVKILLGRSKTLNIINTNFITLDEKNSTCIINSTHTQNLYYILNFAKWSEPLNNKFITFLIFNSPDNIYIAFSETILNLYNLLNTSELVSVQKRHLGMSHSEFNPELELKLELELELELEKTVTQTSKCNVSQFTYELLQLFNNNFFIDSVENNNDKLIIFKLLKSTPQQSTPQQSTPQQSTPQQTTPQQSTLITTKFLQNLNKKKEDKQKKILDFDRILKNVVNEICGMNCIKGGSSIMVGKCKRNIYNLKIEGEKTVSVIKHGGKIIPLKKYT